MEFIPNRVRAAQITVFLCSCCAIKPANHYRQLIIATPESA